MPSYDDFEQLLRKENFMVSAAEFHGVISGMMCGGLAPDAVDWQEKINSIINDGHGLPVEVKKQSQALIAIAHSQLSGDSLNFAPLQPDDDVSIRERLEALALWVQSFLVGFGIICTELKQAEPEIQELIHDFSEISQLSVELDGSSDDNEQAFIEVFEYVRLGAIACFELLSHKNIPPVTTLH